MIKVLAFVFLALVVVCSAHESCAQTTEFTFQGSLKDNAVAANGNYDFEFALFDLLSAGSQIGATIPKNNVPVANGIFSVKLDFGSVFPGAERYLQIRVRLFGQPGFTTLTPRQLVNSAPYSVTSLNAATAGNVTGVVSIANGGTGSSTQNFVDLTSNQNIVGNKTFSTLSGDVVNAATQYNIGGNRFLSMGGDIDSLFVGLEAGRDNTTGIGNSFFGRAAGLANTTGSFNSFVGYQAGYSNLTGSGNSFLGWNAGVSNTAGNNNSFFGWNTGENTTGSSNSFFGQSAGQTNTTGANNTMIGNAADVGSGALTFATAIGAGAIVNDFNTVVVGRKLDTVQIPGNLNLAGTFTGNLPTGSANYIQNQNALFQPGNFTIDGTGTANIFRAESGFNIGGNRVLSVGGSPDVANVAVGVGSGQTSTYGLFNSFFGFNSGQSTYNGFRNSFFGATSGENNTDGTGNTFLGESSGLSNTVENNNTFIGRQANGAAGITNATAVGFQASVTQSNSLVLGNAVNVGIGTSAPLHKLHVVGENVRVEGDTTGTLPRFSINFTGGTVNEKKWQNYATTNRLSFTALNDAETAETFWLYVNRGTGTAISSVIFPNGNVGIGTANPNAKLQVAGGSVYIQNPNSLIITSPNGACWFITVSDAGALSTISVACP